jgi:hypothetical protein
VSAPFALALMGAAIASAQTYYVSPTGSGVACTQVDPCAIEQGTSVGPGSEVVVLPGQYTVSTGLSSLNTANIHGLDGQPRPQISSTYAFAAWSLGNGAANMTFRHIEIETTGSSGVAISGTGTNSIEDVVIGSQGATGSGCAPSLTGGGTVTIKNSICRGDGRGLGINCVGCNETVTARNVTAIGGTNGIGFDSSTGSPSTFTVNVFNSIARQTAGTGADVLAAARTTNSSTTINLDHSNYSSRDEIHNCAVLPCSATVTDPTTNNNQTTAPAFVNAAAGDFHQATGSPTIDAGLDDALNGTADIDGEPRVIGTHTDIGADESPLTVSAPLATPPPSSDRTPPETSLGKRPKKQTERRRAKFTFSSEAGATFKCRLDRRAFVPCASPFVKRVKPGKHTFQVEAIDAAGNIDGTPATAKWKVLTG